MRCAARRSGWRRPEWSRVRKLTWEKDLKDLETGKDTYRAHLANGARGCARAWVGGQR